MLKVLQPPPSCSGPPTTPSCPRHLKKDVLWNKKLKFYRRLGHNLDVLEYLDSVEVLLNAMALWRSAPGPTKWETNSPAIWMQVSYLIRRVEKFLGTRVTKMVYFRHKRATIIKWFNTPR